LHILCLSAGHTVDANTIADSNGHTKDPNNIMYPYNPWYDPCDPNHLKGRGTGITPEQKKIIESGAIKIGNSKEVKEDKKGPTQKPPTVTPVPIKRGRWSDPIDTSVAYDDLSYGFILSQMPFRDVHFYIVYGGLFTNPQYTTLKVWVYLNTDNNNVTGTMFAGLPGVDRRLELDVNFPSNYVYKGSVTTKVYKTGEPDYTTIVPGSVETIGKVIDSSYEGMPPSVRENADGIHLNIPMYLLGNLADEVPAKIVSHDFSSGGHDEATFVWEVVDHNEPVFELVNTRVYPGGMLHFRGYNFTPWSIVKIMVEDELIEEANTDSAGNFEEFTFFPGSLPFSGYFVTAQDISGRSDFSFVEYAPNIADLDWNSKVDFSDFAVIADNWLSGYDE
jgi:hypothetical protein